MEETQQRIKNAVDRTIDELDRKHLRALQKKVLLCSANCCDSTGSRTSVEQCVETCNKPLNKAHNVLENEFGNLQAQMQRCAMTCYDKLVQKLGPDPSKYSDSQMQDFNKEIEKCVSVCGDEHIKVLPTISQRIINSLQ